LESPHLAPPRLIPSISWQVGGLESLISHAQSGPSDANSAPPASSLVATDHDFFGARLTPTIHTGVCARVRVPWTLCLRVVRMSLQLYFT
jgi:hypothetical protein